MLTSVHLFRGICIELLVYVYVDIHIRYIRYFHIHMFFPRNILDTLTFNHIYVFSCFFVLLCLSLRSGESHIDLFVGILLGD